MPSSSMHAHRLTTLSRQPTRVHESSANMENMALRRSVESTNDQGIVRTWCMNRCSSFETADIGIHLLDNTRRDANAQTRSLI